MTKMTSAYANKMLKKLAEDKEYWRRVEVESYLYTAAADEEALIPDYDYATVAGKIDEIDDKICKIKHAINTANVTSILKVGDKEMTVDAILVKMAQLNLRKGVLDNMRKRQPKVRLNSSYTQPKKAVAEYEYINYDLELVKSEYERVDAEISMMQLELDKYNQTFGFEVEI